MRLEPHQPVDDVHAGLLQLARPADVGLLVEAGLDLHQRHDLLAGLGGVDQRVDDRGVAGRAVERLLDRQHVRVGRGLLDEPLHARGERVVGMVHQHVALAEGGEDALRVLPVGERRVRGRDERLVLEVGPVDRVHRPQRGQVEQAGHRDDVGGIHVELAQQQLQHVLAHLVGDLEAHRRPEPAARQLPLQRLEQVLVAVLLDLQVGVAGDAERVDLRDLHAGEELVEVRRDEVLDRQERDVVAVAAGRGGHAHQARHVVGHLDPGEPLGAALRVAHRDGEVEREPGDVRERVGGVDGQRGEDREHLRGEVVREPPVLVVGQLVPPPDVDALLAPAAGRTWSRKHVRVRVGDGLGALARSGASCSRGERPSALRTARPVSSRRFRPATRTM